jgi:hypothetical protein
MQIHAVIEGKTNAHDAPFFTFDGDSLTGYNIAHASVIAEAWNFVHRNLSAVADTAPSGFLHLFFGGPLLLVLLLWPQRLFLQVLSIVELNHL